MISDLISSQKSEINDVKENEQEFKTNFYNPFEVKHRRRTSRAQFKVLEKTFLDNPKPSAPMRRWLAQKLAMSPRGVQVWFQNRRAKEKNKKSKRQSPELLSNPYSMQYTSSPLLSPCACSDCSILSATPISRTLSYPSFYHSDASSTTAGEEENSLLLMMPIDHDKPQCMYEYTPIMNNQQKMPFHPATSPTLWSLNEEEEPAGFIDNRRYSHSVIDHKLGHSTELFRRLSEPIFNTYPNFNLPFNYLTTRPTTYSPM
ncbi:uncharacterized protein BX663DRAFT_477965 [Cokeromyces recurvatus]|uniref:uncharacterized protein n=1 Tax=Cokeromyces recurvatus TaxID=90255 RepID=UPI00221EF89F|nr:uncharacterized protein BX663DRAFT_477965 [Cokeromyces recurvatus]KAI7899692.1 hypothetical protein BX663DRAFT_477965 [Cokeromyces recurvatus]